MGAGRLLWPRWVFLVALIVSGAGTAQGAARGITGEVVSIADGDTLTVLTGRTQVRVRLAEIDAPERKQAFGSVSRQHLARLCFRKPAVVRQQSIDRYGRVVGHVTCAGVNANAAMVRAGMAWAYKRYVRDPAIFAIEAEARQTKRGLWHDPAPLPPWEFRRQ